MTGAAFVLACLTLAFAVAALVVCGLTWRRIQQTRRALDEAWRRSYGRRS
jgi:hypothetical protein